jgi:predicted metal-dependent hydrolase
VNYNIKYGQSNIRFQLDRRDRKTLAIHVYPDQHVEVVAPNNASIEQVFEKVKKRASWIYKKQLEFSRLQPIQPKPEYQTGETFRYLGKQFRLLILVGKPEIKLKHGRFQIICPESYTSTQREKLLISWFRNRGKYIFMERLLLCLRDTTIIEINEIPKWGIKAMPTRWGSCTKEGKIYFNFELLSAPKPCIDYVIFHELCHLLEHNHSPQFYRLLSKVYPDWKKWRDYLNENIEVRMV